MSTYNFEQLLVANELGEVIRLHNQAMERLKTFRESHPHLIAPNLARMAEENLKENVSVLYRELNNLHKPKAEQRRHVCRDCHNVFVVPLPGGICDECRAKLSSPGNVYTARPQMPEAESDTISDATPVPEEELGELGDEEQGEGEGEAPAEAAAVEQSAQIPPEGEELEEEPVAEGISTEAPSEGEEVREEVVEDAEERS